MYYYTYTVNSRYIEAGYSLHRNGIIPPEYKMHSFLSLYNENTVISKEYPGPLDFDITGVDCLYQAASGKLKQAQPDISVFVNSCLE